MDTVKPKGRPDKTFLKLTALFVWQLKRWIETMAC